MSSRFQDLDTDAVSEMITVLEHCCLELQLMCNREAEVIPSKKLIDILCHSLFMATGLIMKLYKRNKQIADTAETEKSLAKKKLKDLLQNIPQILAPSRKKRLPVQHVIIEKHLTTAQYDIDNIFRDNDICQLLVEFIDLDETDNKGNTLLVFVGRIMRRSWYAITPAALRILRFLIDYGAYIYARNRNGKSIIDYLRDASHESNPHS